MIVKSVKLPLSSNFKLYSLAICKRPIKTRGTEIFPDMDVDNFCGRSLYMDENSMSVLESILSFLEFLAWFSDLKKRRSYKKQPYHFVGYKGDIKKKKERERERERERLIYLLAFSVT